MNKEVVKKHSLKIVLEETGCFVSVNDGFKDLFGYENIQKQCKNFLVYVHPHDLDKASIIFDNQADNKIFEARYKTSQGRFKWIRWRIEQKNKKVHLQGEDITEKRSYNEFNKKIRTIVHETSDFVGIADLYGNVAYINEAGKKLVGLDPNFVETEVHLSFFHPKWAQNEIINVALPHCMKEGKWNGRLAVKNQIGEEIPVSAVIMGHKDENGKVGHFSCIMRDISEQIEKEKIIQQQQKEYLDLFNHMQDSILIVNLDNSNIIDCNSSFLEKFHFEKKDVCNHTIHQLYQTRNLDLVKTNIESLKNGTVSSTFNIVQFSNNESFFHVEITAKRYSFFGTNSAIWVIKDISEQMRTETKIRMFAEQLQHSNQHLKNIYSKLQKQSEELAERNKDFVESISYAKKIQTAIFPEKKEFQNIFTESFIFFKPKAIVSGDFYWFHQTKETIIVAVGDCTGHGVPGAFMSMIGVTVLNDIVKSNNIYDPAEILSILNRTVLKTLKQRGAGLEASDGMDIAICTINTSDKLLHFSGANRNLGVVKNGVLEKVLGTRAAIGGYREIPKKFETTSMSFNDIEGVYMTTDGFPDQFGGDKLKKYTTRRFFKLMEEICPLKAQEQEEILEKTLLEWKGNEDQLDDILVVGFNPNSLQLKSSF